ncbi:MAG: 6-bladed beta-propeller [Parabacteroides sp.]|nr:6-bladed beta-propeller [Parabacteroides sp.]
MKNCLLFMILFLNACQYNSSELSDLIVVNLRDGYVDSEINISKEISKIEYVPLELTDDNESMIASILDCCVTDEYVFIVSSKQGGVFQFNRQGRFVRKFAKTGNGPGETQQILSVSADENKSLLYVSELFSTSVYRFDGSFVKKVVSSRGFSYQYLIKDDLMAEIGAEYVPINVPGMFGMGVFNLNGDTIEIKNDFIDSTLTPVEETGLKSVYGIYSKDGLLCSVESNDTIFYLSSSGIKPMYFLKMDNSKESKSNSFSINNQELLPNSFSIFDYFETHQSFYVRAIYNNKMYLFQYDKSTKKTLREISETDPNELVTYNRTMAGIGLRNVIDNGLPIWARKSYPDQNIIVQYYTAPEILYLKDNKAVVKELPSVCKDMNENSNPLVVIYHLK